LVLAAGVGVMLTVGAALSWSVYAHPLMALFNWSSLEVAGIFSVFLFCFGLGAIVGGFQHDRFGPRVTVLLGAALWGLANILAGLGLKPIGLWWMYLTYGVIGGGATGMMYVVPGATASKWFPEERGLANGISLAGFGLGALAFNLILGLFPEVRAMADSTSHFISLRDAAIAAGHAVTMPDAERHGDIAIVRDIFLWSGLAYLIIGTLCAFILHLPPANYSVAKAAEKLSRERDFTPGEMLRTPAFYLVWLMMCVDSTCGLALFSNAVPIYARVAGITAAAATLAFGLVSSANGIGRLFWAWLSDFFGRMPSIAICFALEGGAFLLLANVHGPLLTAIAFAVALLCFGGIFAIAPAVMADFYGTKFFGEDYSFIITAASIGGLLGPLLVAGFEDAFGTLTALLPALGIVLIVSAVLPFITRNPELT
jgi:MFS transporter, OFA family, oxalate/formate antiporter